MSLFQLSRRLMHVLRVDLTPLSERYGLALRGESTSLTQGYQTAIHPSIYWKRPNVKG